MKRVAIVSRLKSFEHEGVTYSIADNMALAETLCARLVKGGYAALAPHAFYPRFLDDTNAGDRLLGVSAGQAWMEVAHAGVVVERYGISGGMLDDINFLRQRGIPRVRWDGKDFDALLISLGDAT